jgi:hypothetical protein
VNNRSVTVSGCGFTNSPVAIGAFSLVIPSSQATGACTLTFTVTNNQGVVCDRDAGVTSRRHGGPGHRARPAGAGVGNHRADPGGDGTTVRYTFDEALTGASVGTGDEAAFAVYRFGAAVCRY